MESGEKKVILILADISGYTRYMISNRTAQVHGQVIITQLMQAIIDQIEIPLEVSKLEGDAVFAYAAMEEDERAWDESKRNIGGKLLKFFKAFSVKIDELTQSNICNCNSCKNIEKLKLKVFVHSGKALLYSIGKFSELSGVDVITIHRLLKNSLKAHEYILLTDAAVAEIELPGEIELVKGYEKYDDVGTINTYTHLFKLGDGFPEKIVSGRNYSSPVSKAKNEILKMIQSKFITWGLKKPPRFNNLPDISP